MSTIYTVNNKVLKNSANDKWLIKKEAPAGFVMNGSNATITELSGTYFVSWQGPAYPDGYNGNGKQYVLVNNNTTAQQNNQLMYGNSPTSTGPNAINGAGMAVLGTSNGTLLNNLAGGTYGAYLVWPNPAGSGVTLAQVQAYLANVTITIVDP